MQFGAIISLACLIAAVPALEAQNHPIGSVIRLLDTLQQQVAAEAKAELTTFNTFKKWCTDSGVDLTKEVKGDNQAISVTSDFISGKEKEDDVLTGQIAHLGKEIIKFENENDEASEMRDHEEEHYEEVHEDLLATVKAVGEAIKALKVSKDGKKKPEFLQLRGNKVKVHALQSLMQQPLVLEQLSATDQQALSAMAFGHQEPAVTDEDILNMGKAEAAAPIFKSDSVIAMLEKMKVEFVESATKAVKAETAAKNEYDTTTAARTQAMSAARKTKAAKASSLSGVKSDTATSSGELKNENGELVVDTKAEEDTEKTCRMKVADYNKRNTLRHHEMAAMKAAEEVLKKASGVSFEKPVNKKAPKNPAADPEFVQVAGAAGTAASSLVQVENPRLKAITLLKERAAKSHSNELATFANRLAAKIDGPLDSITQTVQQMIFRLMAEQTKEDEHKHWCDLEISNSEASRDDKSIKVTSLASKIKSLKANSAALTLGIQDLDKKADDLMKYMNEATEVRKEGKQENAVAIKDAQAAQTAIAKATAVLTTFYKNSGQIEKESWEFLQTSADELPKKPETWTSSYTGVTDPENAQAGVLAVLQSTAADFSKMEADTKSQEASDQKAFDEDIQAATIDKAKTVKESEMKADEKKRADDKVRSMEKSHQHVTSEHAAVEQYLTDLEGSCGKSGEDAKYNARKGARDDEIKALKDAKSTLENAFTGKGEEEKVAPEEPVLEEVNNEVDGKPVVEEAVQEVGGALLEHRSIAKHA